MDKLTAREMAIIALDACLDHLGETDGSCEFRPGESSLADLCLRALRGLRSGEDIGHASK